MSDTDKIVYFDGMCNLCNGVVKFILKNEKHPTLRFAPLQSANGHRMLRQNESPLDAEITTIIFSDGLILRQKADAVFALAAHLRAPYSWLRFFNFLPRFISNGIYDLVARHRYRLFGQQETCMVPTPELSARFVD